MPKEYYTYLYLRKDGTPFYVGKGHGNRAFSKDHLVKVPPSDRVKIIPMLDEAAALAYEQYLIGVYGRKDLGTGCLRNLTPGGDAPPKGNRKGSKHTPEAIEKNRLAHIGRPSWNRGTKGVMKRNSGSFYLGQPPPSKAIKPGNIPWNKGAIHG